MLKILSLVVLGHFCLFRYSEPVVSENLLTKNSISSFRYKHTANPGLIEVQQTNEYRK